MTGRRPMKIPPHPARSLRRLLAQRGEARRFAAKAWLAAPAVEASLALLGLRRTLDWIEAISTRARTPPAGAVGLGEGARLVEGVYRAHFVDGRCLPRSLLQYWLHRADGVPARFVVGVRRQSSGPEPLEGHAWVEPPEGSAAVDGSAGYSVLMARGDA